MKTYRPYCLGYLIIYILTAISFADVVRTLITYNPEVPSPMAGFEMWSMLILVAALVFANHYFKSRVSIGKENMQIVQVTYIKPAPGQKRANFLFRQEDLDNVIVDKRFPIAGIEKYGYVEDLGLKNRDKSSGTPKAKMFPLHEVAFIMRDGGDYRLNAAVYSPRQRTAMLSQIREKSGVEPTGALALEAKAA